MTQGWATTKREEGGGQLSCPRELRPDALQRAEDPRLPLLPKTFLFLFMPLHLITSDTKDRDAPSGGSDGTKVGAFWRGR